jgi:hypothetical protein
MIEMLGDLIAGILGLVRKGEFEKASDKLENLYNQILREDSAFFMNIPDNELTDKLIREHNYTNGHLEVLAELFNAEAELCFAQGDMKGTIRHSVRALRLFEFIDAENKTYYQDRIDKMESLRQRILNLTGN